MVIIVVTNPRTRWQEMLQTGFGIAEKIWVPNKLIVRVLVAFLNALEVFSASFSHAFTDEHKEIPTQTESQLICL